MTWTRLGEALHLAGQARTRPRFSPVGTGPTSEIAEVKNNAERATKDPSCSAGCEAVSRWQTSSELSGDPPGAATVQRAAA